MYRYEFKAAKPIWAKGRQTEINLHLGFAATIPAAEKATLAIAAQCVYRLFVNGKFVAFGPARACHDYYRVDEIVLDGLLTRENNTVAVEVAGYNADSYYLLDKPSFLCAEVLAGGKAVAATGTGDFVCTLLPEYAQKVQRYSFQRTFVEDYKLAPGYDDWRKGIISHPVLQEVTEPKTFLERSVPYPQYETRTASYTGGGTYQKIKPETYKDNRILSLPEEPESLYKGFRRDEMESVMYYDLQEYAFTLSSGSPTKIAAGHFSLYDLGLNATGMMRLTVNCKEKTSLYLMFDECLEKGIVDPLRMDTCNAVRYRLEPGSYDLMALEPVTMKVISIMVTEGEAEISDLRMTEYKFRPITATLKSENPRLQAVYNAAIETFRQNTLDIYMDCPSRERAGWLCDSFFTSRVERCLTGESLVERNFLENFLLPESFPYQPKGIFPMCYPSDHNNGRFIPNWAMWLVIELEEYLHRTGDSEMIAAFKPKVYDLFAYFAPFENEDGLLEKLESWIFVEWSKANELTQDVNFPTNMLFAGTLEAAGRIYNDPALLQKAAQMKEKIRELSFDGQFFTDNLVRKEGKLVPTGERTEVCQYYAFFFDVATPETYPELWKIMTTDFGPHRSQTGAWSEIYPANAFIGNYLRLDLLSRYGLLDQLLGEIEGYFYYMAERTGTLWENTHDRASMNHGFASHVILWLDKICGLER